MRTRRSVLFALAALLCGGSSSSAAEFDQYCNLMGFDPPVRQTMIVIDEQHVLPETGVVPEPRNAQWRQFIGNMLFADAANLEQNFLPRERVAIFIARKDGAGTRNVFSGCLPFFSPAERSKIQRDAGYMGPVNTFFGTGVLASARKDMDVFKIRVGEGFRDALLASALSATNGERQANEIASSGLISSLKQGNFINLNYGVPRVIVYSDMTRFFDGVADRIVARQRGLEKGKAAELNLQGAEVHVVGMTAGGTVRDALEMFFLAAHGELISTASSTSLPSFAASPVRVARYQGTIQYPTTKFPIRIRLAADQSGTLVNSWVSVQTSGEQFSPLHGVLTCMESESCSFVGDDVFSQVWNVKRSTNGTPFLDQSMPFGGARSFTFAIDKSVAKGAISDSLIKFEGLSNNKLEFTADLQPSALY